MASQPDPREYRRTIGLFATGVTVVAVETEGGVHGMTANAVTSVSLEPLLLLVCVDKRARMAGYLEEGKGFTVNILREEQQALSNYFAGAWKEEAPPPFRFVEWEGLPRLEGALASLGCRVAERIEAGDHWIVLGEVTALHRGIEPHRPLLFFAGRYACLEAEQREEAPDMAAMEGTVMVYYDPWRGDE